MIQDIFPHTYDITFKVPPEPPFADDYVIVLRGAKILLDVSDAMRTLPRHGDLKAAYPGLGEDRIYLFAIDDHAVYYFPDELAATDGYDYHDTMFFRGFRPRWMAFAGITASHLAQWYRKNRYCGSCGAAMSRRDNERALVCPVCRTTAYPAVAPAVIVGIIDGDRLLMIRYANRPNVRWALVAGFTDVGETFEGTVRREVMEEVGLKVNNFRYYKSQPWGFSGSILAGFFVDLDGSPEITLDLGELQEAAWIARADIPVNPTDISLTSEMIEVFRQGEHPLITGFSRDGDD